MGKTDQCQATTKQRETCTYFTEYIVYTEEPLVTQGLYSLTHWGQATHIWVSKLTIIVSDNGLSPDRRQAIIWNNVGMLSIGLLGTNFSEILIKILTFSFKKMRLKMSSGKWRPSCLGLNVLRGHSLIGVGFPITWDSCQTILALQWEFLYLWNHVFLVNRGPGSMKHYIINMFFFCHFFLYKHVVLGLWCRFLYLYHNIFLVNRCPGSEKHYIINMFFGCCFYINMFKVCNADSYTYTTASF